MLQKSIQEIFQYEKENRVNCPTSRSVDSQLKKYIVENKKCGYVFITIPYNKDYGIQYVKFPFLTEDAKRWYKNHE